MRIIYCGSKSPDSPGETKITAKKALTPSKFQQNPERVARSCPGHFCRSPVPNAATAGELQ